MRLVQDQVHPHETLDYQVQRLYRSPFDRRIENAKALGGKCDAMNIQKLMNLAIFQASADCQKETSPRATLLKSLWAIRDQWEVMGHWRIHDGSGKDRNGHRTMKGFTWVVPHVKGPDSVPLIVKTRIIGSDRNLGHSKLFKSLPPE